MKMEERIMEILKEIRSDSDFENCRNYIEDFLLDSFDIINLASELENVFHIKINGDHIIPDNFNNIEALTKMVKQLGGM